MLDFLSLRSNYVHETHTLIFFSLFLSNSRLNEHSNESVVMFHISINLYEYYQLSMIKTKKKEKKSFALKTNIITALSNQCGTRCGSQTKNNGQYHPLLQKICESEYYSCKKTTCGKDAKGHSAPISERHEHKIFHIRSKVITTSH